METNNIPESWRPVVGYEGHYEVSDQGRVRGVDRIIVDRRNTRLFKGKVLVATPNKWGYLQVPLSKDGKVKRATVHRLVTMAFHGIPDDGQVCCHNNGVKADNRAANLRWDTRSANELDKLVHGTHRGSQTHCKRGHPFDAENTRIRADGYRMCRECNNMMKRAWHHRTKITS